MKIKSILVLSLLIFPTLFFSYDISYSASSDNEETIVSLGEGKECIEAGGKISMIKECNGSESAWCEISEKEQCYADRVRGGHCTVGRYDEEAKGIVGFTPKVLCDKEQ